MPDRTPEQKSHDLAILVIDDQLRIIRTHLGKMEQAASNAKEYSHAQNYQKISAFLRLIIS